MLFQSFRDFLSQHPLFCLKSASCLAIDYGTSKCGLAEKKKDVMIGFSKENLKNDSNFVSTIADLILQNKYDILITGLPVDSEQSFLDSIYKFAQNIEKLTNIKIILHDERFSTSAMDSFINSSIGNTSFNYSKGYKTHFRQKNKHFSEASHKIFKQNSKIIQKYSEQKDSFVAKLFIDEFIDFYELKSNL